MAKNEEGEFELILGNKQLFAVFFIVVALFGVFFVMGYRMGQSSPPPARAEVASTRRPEAKPAVAEPTSKSAEPDEVAPSNEAPAPPKTREQPRTTPPSKTAPAAISNEIIVGKPYLQLTATDRDHADGMVDLLRKNGFKALVSEVPEKPGLYRVLVGPIGDGELNKVRAELQAKSFPGNAAIKRTF